MAARLSMSPRQSRSYISSRPRKYAGEYLRTSIGIRTGVCGMHAAVSSFIVEAAGLTFMKTIKIRHYNYYESL